MYRTNSYSGHASDSNQLIYILLIAIVCFFAFFVNNQVIPADLMEARNLATAQEMVQTGNYLIPTLNGELRLEKPPLPTWIAAGIEKMAPRNLVVQRYAAGLAATLMVFFLYLLVVRFTRHKKAAFLSALIFATCFNIVMMGRTATWDIYCHCFMLGAIWLLVGAFEKDDVQWKYFIGAGILMGLSFLSKGPVSFFALLLPFLIGYLIVYRPSVKQKVWPLIVMTGICLVISCWWPVYVTLFQPDSIDVAQKESASWLNHNVRPWYYYWQFPAEAGAWALFLVTSIVCFYVYKKREWRNEYQFALIWLVTSLVLLSLMPEKKTRYLLPILVPGAILICIYILYSMKGFAVKSEKIIFRINAMLIAILFLAAPVILYFLFYTKGQLSIFVLILSALLSWGLSFYLFFSLFGRNGIRVGNVFTAIVLGMILVETVYMIPIGNLFINTDRNSISQLHHNQEIQSLPYYCNQEEELRMEEVYQVCHIIQKMDVTNDSLI
ncbi:MAG: glycosyltransferase family 39 protein, partial [Tannerella sp.]|nr:glycosyltransferase family 39 protein [Tannerella sp.]